MEMSVLFTGFPAMWAIYGGFLAFCVVMAIREGK